MGFSVDCESWHHHFSQEHKLPLHFLRYQQWCRDEGVVCRFNQTAQGRGDDCPVNAQRFRAKRLSFINIGKELAVNGRVKVSQRATQNVATLEVV